MEPIRPPVVPRSRPPVPPGRLAPDPFAGRLVDTPRAGRRPVHRTTLAVGLVLAVLLTALPPLRFLGWLFGSLFHETGHVAFAWYVGCPAFPAISLAGHAAAFHQDQRTSVCVLVLLLLGLFAVAAFRSGRFRVLAVVLLALWPVFAMLPGPREVGFLLSGHGGELAFAALFLWRARTGEDVLEEEERPGYAMLGWFLVIRNALLAAGLAFSAGARDAYRGNGSFGLLNDYARLADEHLHLPLAAVGIFMLVASVGVVALVLVATSGEPDGPDR